MYGTTYNMFRIRLMFCPSAHYRCLCPFWCLMLEHLLEHLSVQSHSLAYTYAYEVLTKEYHHIFGVITEVLQAWDFRVFVGTSFQNCTIYGVTQNVLQSQDFSFLLKHEFSTVLWWWGDYGINIKCVDTKKLSTPKVICYMWLNPSYTALLLLCCTNVVQMAHKENCDFGSW